MGYPSEAQVKRGPRSVRGGEKELIEKLGDNDLCPCGSGRRFKKCCRNSGRFRWRHEGSLRPGALAAPTCLRSSADERRASNPETEVRLLSGALTPWPSGEARACKARYGGVGAPGGPPHPPPGRAA